MFFLDSLLNFLELDKSTLKKISKEHSSGEKKENNEVIENAKQEYQIFENTQIIEKDNKELEIKTVTEIIPIGNEKAVKKTRIQENVLKR